MRTSVVGGGCFCGYFGGGTLGSDNPHLSDVKIGSRLAVWVRVVLGAVQGVPGRPRARIRAQTVALVTRKPTRNPPETAAHLKNRTIGEDRRPTVGPKEKRKPLRPLRNDLRY